MGTPSTPPLTCENVIWGPRGARGAPDAGLSSVRSKEEEKGEGVKQGNARIRGTTGTTGTPAWRASACTDWRASACPRTCRDVPTKGADHE